MTEDKRDAVLLMAGVFIGVMLFFVVVAIGLK
jgi:hypothetical protein